MSRMLPDGLPLITPAKELDDFLLWLHFKVNGEIEEEVDALEYLRDRDHCHLTKFNLDEILQRLVRKKYIRFGITASVGDGRAAEDSHAEKEPVVLLFDGKERAEQLFFERAMNPATEGRVVAKPTKYDQRLLPYIPSTGPNIEVVTSVYDPTGSKDKPNEPSKAEPKPHWLKATGSFFVKEIVVKILVIIAGGVGVAFVIWYLAKKGIELKK